LLPCKMIRIPPNANPCCNQLPLFAGRNGVRGAKSTHGVRNV
jgi:hypothetical protein